MTLVVRSWNLFHGRTHPETGEVRLERMIRLATEDEPHVVCLQEVPLWAVEELEEWSAMDARVAVTKRAWLGPLARRLQALEPRRVRSPFTGQANAVLVRRSLRVESTSADVVNRGQPGERRVCQRLLLREGRASLLVANIHLSNRPPAARLELERVRALVGTDGGCLVCGDLNLPGTGLPGFSPPLPGIDQILARSLAFARPPVTWPDERRRAGPGLLSDHAPVEAEMIWP